MMSGEDTRLNGATHNTEEAEKGSDRAIAHPQLQGQWFGNYTGTNSGHVLLNLDRRVAGYSGSAAIIDTNDAFPSAVYVASMSMPDDHGRIAGHLDLNLHFERQTNRYLHEDELRERYPEVVTARRLEATGILTEDVLSFEFSGDANTSGSASFSRFRVPDQTIVPRRVVTWDQFKGEVRSSDNRGKLYRGQPRPDPLRTAFHRAERFDILRFALEDVARLASAITSVTDQTFNMADPRIHGAVLGIAQHHGYPTPLLDWSKSPYVAAYFACRDAATGPNKNGLSPTIFAIDANAWAKHHQRAQDVNAPLPALAFVEPLPLKNPRLLPQQSVLVYCNVDNFEHFVKQRESITKVTYLTAYSLIDNPAEILRDLRMMGVYAASLFPGLDGMCRGVFEDFIEIG